MKNLVITISKDDYTHELYDLHKKRSVRNFSIRKIIIPKDTRQRFYHKKLGILQCKHLDDYPIVQLVKDEDGVLMTDTPFEIETNAKAISKAKGDVLELGLGIGFFTYHATNKKNVKTVTIVEWKKPIIDLVYPVISNYKTDVIQANARTFLKTTKKKFDMINIDFVSGMQPFEEIDLLKKLAERCLKPSGIVVYWQEDVWKTVKKFIPKKPVKQSPFSFTNPPCHVCGKMRRMDYAGFCDDCASILNIIKYTKKKIPRKANGKVDDEKYLKLVAKEMGLNVRN